MVLSQIHKEILQLLRQGKNVVVHDREANHMVFFDKDRGGFYYKAEGDFGLHLNELKDENAVLNQLEMICEIPLSGYVGDVMWLGILDRMQRSS